MDSCSNLHIEYLENCEKFQSLLIYIRNLKLNYQIIIKLSLLSFNSGIIASTFILKLFYSQKLTFDHFHSQHSCWEPIMPFFSAISVLCLFCMMSLSCTAKKFYTCTSIGCSYQIFYTRVSIFALSSPLVWTLTRLHVHRPM